MQSFSLGSSCSQKGYATRRRSSHKKNQHCYWR